MRPMWLILKSGKAELNNILEIDFQLLVMIKF
jgi:hypothetical protein